MSTPTVLLVLGPRFDGLESDIDARTDHEVTVPSGSGDVTDCLAETSADCLLVSQSQREGSGLDLVRSVRDAGRDHSVVLVAADGSEQLASDALAAGADDYVPVDPAEPAVGELVDRVEDGAAAAIEDTWSREQYETIINAVPDPVYSTDEHGRFEFVNDAMEEMTGYEFAEARDEGVFLGMTESDLETSRALIRELLDDDNPREKGVFEMDLITRDGRSFPVENHMALLPHDEGYQGTAGVLRDISGERRRKRRLDVLGTVLRHNLRNDMNVIVGYAELLADRLDDPELGAAAESIQSKAREMIRIGNEVRTLQNAIEETESGRYASTIDVVPIIDRVVDQFQNYHENGTVRADCPSSLTVTGDSLLQRALSDLVENALEHNDHPEPDVLVSVEEDCDPPQSAASDAAVATEWVAIRVVDNGPGIPEYERELVTGAEDITPLKHGSGLGLWVVTWIIESFGGAVTIEERTERRSGTEAASETDPRGTVVTLRLMRAERDD